MKINWKVRVQNPWFWISLFGVIFSPVITLIGVALVSVLSFLGISADPTTKGLSDSEQAMTYTSPKK